MSLPDKIMWVLIIFVMAVSAYFTFSSGAEQVTIENVLEWLIKFIIIFGAGFFVGHTDSTLKRHNEKLLRLRLDVDELQLLIRSTCTAGISEQIEIAKKQVKK